MEGPNEPTGGMQPLRQYQVLALGSFGESVLQCVRELCPRSTYSLTSREDVLEGRLSPSCSAYLLIAQQPEPALCDLLDDHAHRQGVAFLPLVIEADRLRLGPAALPEQGACWHCGVLRRLQHGVGIQHSSKLHHDLAPYVLLAGSRLAWMLRAFESERLHAGSTWQMDLITTEVRQGLVIGVHGCPRCGLKRSMDTLSIDQMRLECAELWTQASDAT